MLIKTEVLTPSVLLVYFIYKKKKRNTEQRDLPFSVALEKNKILNQI